MSHHDSVIFCISTDYEILVFATESFLIYFLIFVSSHSTANTQLLKRENCDIRFQKFKKKTFRIWFINYQFEFLNQSYSNIHFHVIIVSFHFSIFDINIFILNSIISSSLYASWKIWKISKSKNLIRISRFEISKICAIQKITNHEIANAKMHYKQ